MKHSVTALLLTITVAAASSAVTPATAQTAITDNASKFQTFDATPKAPRKEVVTDRQIVVEPRIAAPKSPPVASLPQPTETFEVVKNKPVAEETQPQTQVVEEEIDQPSLDEQTFAPQKATEAAKAEIPTVFTPKQKQLFTQLSPAQQTAMVEKLITKHGYDAMYPAHVSRTYLDDYRTKQSKYDEAYHGQSYNEDTSYGYTTSYGSAVNDCQ